MSRPPVEGLTPRESEVMEIIWRRGEATVGTIQGGLRDRISGSSVRSVLQIMEHKGYVAVRKDERANLYVPLVTQEEVRRSVLSRVIERFFGGSAEGLVAHMVQDKQISPEDVEILRKRFGDTESQGKHP